MSLSQAYLFLFKRVIAFSANSSKKNLQRFVFNSFVCMIQLRVVILRIQYSSLGSSLKVRCLAFKDILSFSFSPPLRSSMSLTIESIEETPDTSPNLENTQRPAPGAAAARPPRDLHLAALVLEMRISDPSLV